MSDTQLSRPINSGEKMEERVKINRKVKFFYGLGDLSANI